MTALRQHRLDVALSLQIILAAFMTLCATDSYAQNLIGKKVTVIKWEAEFRSDNNQVIGTSELGKNYEVYTVKGNKLFVRERDGYILRADVVPYENAVNHFTTIVKRKLAANAYYDRGCMYDARGEQDEALKDYNEAIRKNAKFSEVYNARANIWSQKEEYDKALADYGKSLQLDPMCALVMCNRGMVWVAKNDLDRALVDYNEALNIDSSYSPAYRARAEVWQKKLDFKKALADYNEALRLDPGDQDSREQRALINAVQGNYDDAISDYNELLRRDPTHAKGLQARGLVWMRKGTYITATADLEQAIEVDPTDINSYLNLAIIRVAAPDDSVRDTKKATELLEKAQELKGPNKAYASIIVEAAIQAELGNFEKAIEIESRLSKTISDTHKADHEARLKLYQEHKPYRLSIQKPATKGSDAK